MVLGLYIFFALKHSGIELATAVGAGFAIAVLGDAVEQKIKGRLQSAKQD